MRNLWVCLIVFFGVTATIPALSQHHRRHHIHHHGRLPAYEVSSESTLEGSVDELVLLTRPGCSGCEGATHAFLIDHDIEIHLGPFAYLEEHGCTIKEGDSIRVTGSLLSPSSGSLMLVRLLHCGDRTVTLRDEAGRPLWSQSGR